MASRFASLLALAPSLPCMAHPPLRGPSRRLWVCINSLQQKKPRPHPRSSPTRPHRIERIRRVPHISTLATSLNRPRRPS